MILFSIAPVQHDADLQDCVTVKNRLSPADEQMTVAEMRHDWENSKDSLFLIARQGDAVAGSLVCKPSGSPGVTFTMMRVLPEFRGQGLGTAFYEAASHHARAIGREVLQGRAVETDQDALDYFAKRGFTEVARECKVVLNLTDVPESAAEIPAGVEICNLSDRRDLAEGAYAVAAEALPDIPFPEPITAPPLDEWIASEITAPHVLLAGSFVAVADGQVIGYAGLAESGEATAEHLLTGVSRAWRGRGIASALKQQQLKWAKSAGIQQLVTYNEQGNDPMRGINLRLGYQPQPAFVVLRGPLHAGT